MSLNDVFPFEPYMHVDWVDYGLACIVVECYLLVPQVSCEIKPAVMISDVVFTDPSFKSHFSH